MPTRNGSPLEFALLSGPTLLPSGEIELRVVPPDPEGVHPSYVRRGDGPLGEVAGRLVPYLQEALASVLPAPEGGQRYLRILFEWNWMRTSKSAAQLVADAVNEAIPGADAVVTEVSNPPSLDEWFIDPADPGFTNLDERFRTLDGVSLKHRGEMVLIRVNAYENGGAPAITFITSNGEPVATLSVNAPGTALAPDEFIAKTWSENEEIASAALRSGWFEDTGRRVPMGYVEGQVWRTTIRVF